jgi:hypothetical protein
MLIPCSFEGGAKGGGEHSGVRPKERNPAKSNTTHHTVPLVEPRDSLDVPDKEDIADNLKHCDVLLLLWWWWWW